MDPLQQKAIDVFKQIPFGDNGTNIVDANIVHSMSIEGSTAHLVLVIGKENEGIRDTLGHKIREDLTKIDGIDQVAIRFTLSEDEAKASLGTSPQQAHYLKDYTNVVLISSGKGGVGKSTIAVNLALALKALGKKVSLIDADVFGPSIPAMLNAREERVYVEKDKIKPIERLGMQFMSIGNMVDEEVAVIWRGPMVHQAIEQILRDSAWDGGDYMIIDLPPGTGDVQITIAQLTQASGSVVVCTPQDVALLDARKAMGMFGKVNIPIIGLIENMSSFVCPKCGAETPIFSKGGIEKESQEKDIPFLGRIPIELEVRLGGDSGEPVVDAMPNSAVAKSFKEMAQNLINTLE
jgi:ATP-binding protein involved in chromosome partitioning